jgi:hypothetical protein
MALSEIDKDRLAEWHREITRRIVAGEDEAFPGTPPVTDEELRAALCSLTDEEAAYVRSLAAAAAASARERLGLVTERLDRQPPADDPVLRRIDESGIADEEEDRSTKRTRIASPSSSIACSTGTWKVTRCYGVVGVRRRRRSRS